MTWVLILMVYGGSGESRPINISSVPGFTSQSKCWNAGRNVEREFARANKKVKYRCEKQ